MIMSMTEYKAFDWKNKQAVFEFVIDHLWVQGKRSEGADPHGDDLDDDVVCLYRSGDLACAAGCLIPDEIYTENMEGVPAPYLGGMEEFSPPIWENIENVLELINELQNFHDHSYPRDFRSSTAINKLALRLGFEKFPDSFFENLREKVSEKRNTD